MDVLGHEYVCVDGKVVGLAGFLDDSFERVFYRWVFEERKTTVTTEGDEVEVARLLESLYHPTNEVRGDPDFRPGGMDGF
jgi:hypothetical protein